MLTAAGAASFSDRSGQQHVLRGQPLLSQPLRWLAFAAALHPRLGSSSPVHSISPDLMEMVMAQRLGRPPRRALEKMIREVWAWRVFQLPHIAAAALGAGTAGTAGGAGGSHQGSQQQGHRAQQASRVEIAAVFGRGPVAAAPAVAGSGIDPPGIGGIAQAGRAAVDAAEEAVEVMTEEEEIAAAVSHFPAVKQATLTAALSRMGDAQRKRTIDKLREQRQEQLEAIADAEAAAAETQAAAAERGQHDIIDAPVIGGDRQQQVDAASRELFTAAVERGRRWQERNLGGDEVPTAGGGGTAHHGGAAAAAAAAAAERMESIQAAMVLRQMVDMVRTLCTLWIHATTPSSFRRRLRRGAALSWS